MSADTVPNVTYWAYDFDTASLATKGVPREAVPYVNHANLHYTTSPFNTHQTIVFVVGLVCVCRVCVFVLF